MKHLPNVVSAARILMGVCIFVASANHYWQVAWWLFTVAALSDLVDGWLARRLGVVSKRGHRLDRQGDFVLLVGTPIGMLIGGGFPAYTFVILSGTLPGMAVGAWLSYRQRNTPAGISPAQYATSAIAFAFLLTFLGLRLVSLAYGWQWWYIAVTAGVLATAARMKRTDLKALFK